MTDAYNILFTGSFAGLRARCEPPMRCVISLISVTFHIRVRTWRNSEFVRPHSVSVMSTSLIPVIPVNRDVNNCADSHRRLQRDIADFGREKFYSSAKGARRIPSACHVRSRLPRRGVSEKNTMTCNMNVSILIAWMNQSCQFHVNQRRLVMIKLSQLTFIARTSLHCNWNKEKLILKKFDIY